MSGPLLPDPPARLTRSGSTATPFLFPMYVLRVKDFLGLDVTRAVPCHQELLQAQKLTVWESGLGPVAFVSHQWMSFDHADPDFSQLGTLRGIIERIQNGSISRIQTDWLQQVYFGIGAQSIEKRDLCEWVDTGFLWFDYFSVPQTVGYDFDAGPELLDAVNSIPAYVAQSKHFLILCPPLEHKDLQDGQFASVCDYASWSTRGWCRAEVAARLLATDSGPMIKIDSAQGQPVLMSPFDAWNSSPREGEFSCCSRGHVFKRSDGEEGRRVPCDRPKVAEVMRMMLQRKVEALSHRLQRCEQARAEAGLNIRGAAGPKESEEEKLLLEFRWIQSMQEHMIGGLHDVVLDGERDGGCDEQREDGPGEASTIREEESGEGRGRGASETETVGRFMAAYRFDLAAVDGTEREHQLGWTPLRFAAMAGQEGVVRHLLEQGADVEAPVAEHHAELSVVQGATVLLSAAAFGSAAVVQLLLDRGANPRARDLRGLNALAYASSGGKRRTLRLLLLREPGLSLLTDRYGNNALMFACLHNHGRGAAELVQVLLDALAASTAGGLALKNGFGAEPLTAAATAERGDRRVLECLLRHAGFAGRVNAQTQWSDIRWKQAAMLAYGHAAQLVNRVLGVQDSTMVAHFAYFSAGLSALMRAASNGSVPYTRTLLAAGADPLLRDARGRTARDHARLCGPYPLVDQLLEEAEHAWATRSRAQSR